MRQLIFIHGRAQEHKDAVALKSEWLDAWREGLAKTGKSIPIPETAIRFPYYGQTLFDLVAGAATPAEVIVRGAAASTVELEFTQAVIEEIQKETGITDDQVEEVLAPEVRERGPLNWEWLQGILKAIDKHVPGASGRSIALTTKDVFQYLKNPGIRATIESGVLAAFAKGVPTVVVSHSLGTVVAFNMLRRDGERLGWEVPLFVTLGSPLGVRAIHAALSPIEHPACVGHWYNAFDERDVVSLYPLDTAHFDVDPAIENNDGISNKTTNRHGIAGYLDDKDVASRIHESLTSTAD